MTISIRPAEPQDVPGILALVVALAVFEREPDAVKATEASLADTLFGPDAQVFAHVVEEGGEMVGTAVWFLTYSTWTGRPSLYLEDLFVSERVRGQGVGRLIVRTLAREALARKCARIDWSVLEWNATAKDFYRRIGGRPAEGWEPWRLEGEALHQIAGLEVPAE